MHLITLYIACRKAFSRKDPKAKIKHLVNRIEFFFCREHVEGIFVELSREEEEPERRCVTHLQRSRRYLERGDAYSVIVTVVRVPLRCFSFLSERTIVYRIASHRLWMDKNDCP